MSSCTVEDVLLLLRHLFVITTSHNEELNELIEYSNVSSEFYSSKKITNKLLQVGVFCRQIRDVLTGINLTANPRSVSLVQRQFADLVRGTEPVVSVPIPVRDQTIVFQLHGLWGL